MADGAEPVSPVSTAEVRRITRLAGLELDDDALDRLAGEVAGILAHVTALGDAEDAEDADRGPAAALRPDEPGGDPLARAPTDFAVAFRDGFFLVPRLASHETGGDGSQG